VQTVVDTCLAHNVGVGIHCVLPDPDLALSWARLGCNLMVYASDTMFVLDGVEKGLGAVRRALADETGSG